MRFVFRWALLGFFGLAFLGAGCDERRAVVVPFSLGSGGATAPGAAPGTGAGALPAPGQWYVGDLHLHTTHSRDARRQKGDGVGMSLRLCEAAGLDFVAITDHNNRKHGTDPDFTSSRLILLSGEEWGGSSHAGIVGGTQDLPMIDESQPPFTWNAQVQQSLDQAHADGAIVVVNHAAGFNFWLWDVPAFDAVEIWNGYWTFLHEIPLLPVTTDIILQSKGMLQAGLDVSPELRKALGAKGGQNEQALAFWEAHLDAGRRLAAVGGGDRHMIVMPGRPATFVLATAPTPDAILQAIREGRTYVAHRPDGARIEFRADADADGVFEARIGDDVPVGVRVTFEISVQNASGGRALLVKNGAPIGDWPLPTASETIRTADTPTAPAWYRLDVLLPIPSTVPWPQVGKLGPFLGSTLDSLQILALSAGFIHPTPTQLPTVDPPELYERYLHRTLQDPAWSRAIISSPIYAR